MKEKQKISIENMSFSVTERIRIENISSASIKSHF